MSAVKQEAFTEGWVCTLVVPMVRTIVFRYIFSRPSEAKLLKIQYIVKRLTVHILTHYPMILAKEK